jgi:hypothetical protein
VLFGACLSKAYQWNVPQVTYGDIAVIEWHYKQHKKPDLLILLFI